MTTQLDVVKINTDNAGGKAWFEAAKSSGFGLILPSGWLGRPFDNIHELNEYRIDQNEIFFRFDDMREVLIKGARNIYFTKSISGRTNITFSNFDEAKFTWVPYGNEGQNPTIKIFDSGELELFGYHVYI